MSSIVVRPARLEDLQTIRDLNHELFLHDAERFHDLNPEWPHTEEGKAYFTDKITSKSGVCFAAEQNGEVVGYVAGGLSKPNTGYKGKRAELENIFVRPNVRSKGAGAKLVEAFYGWCRDQGADYVEVEGYYSNVRAMGFYEKQGFEKYHLKLLHKL